jgi:2-succinyl-6-hydroxy-2,4-cyclohexadiene-1-carboxylate synthase
LLHGFTGSVKNWRDQMTRLGHHYRVLAVDLPGHGRTDAPDELERYRMEHVAGDLVTLLDVLGATPVHWLGYSMGGRLALYAAIHHPQATRSIILESASPGLADESERQARRDRDEALAARIEREGVPAFVAEWERLPLFATQGRLPASGRAALREQRLANSASGLAGSLRGMGTGAQPSLWDQLGTISRPTLLIAGELDGKFVVINRRMAAAIRGAKLQIIPDAGHTTHLERPELFATAVLAFLARLRKENAKDLTGAEQSDESQRGQRHLPEPRVEGRQIVGTADRQAIAHQQGQSQQVEELPD